MGFWVCICVVERKKEHSHSHFWMKHGWAITKKCIDYLEVQQILSHTTERNKCDSDILTLRKMTTNWQDNKKELITICFASDTVQYYFKISTHAQLKIFFLPCCFPYFTSYIYLLTVFFFALLIKLSKHATHRTIKQIYGSRRVQQVLLLFSLS